MLSRRPSVRSRQTPGAMSERGTSASASSLTKLTVANIRQFDSAVVTDVPSLLSEIGVAFPNLHLVPIRLERVYAEDETL